MNHKIDQKNDDYQCIDNLFNFDDDLTSNQTQTT